MNGDGRDRNSDDAPVFLKDIDLSKYEFQGDEEYVAEALLGYMLEQRTMYIEETPMNSQIPGENVQSYQAVGIDWRDMVMEIMAEDPQGINPYKAYGVVIMDGEPEDEYPKINENFDMDDPKLKDELISWLFCYVEDWIVRKADEAGLSENGDYERLHTVADRVFEADISDMEADALAGRGEFGRFFGDLTLALTQN